MWRIYNLKTRLGIRILEKQILEEQCHNIFFERLYNYSKSVLSISALMVLNGLVFLHLSINFLY